MIGAESDACSGGAISIVALSSLRTSDVLPGRVHLAAELRPASLWPTPTMDPSIRVVVVPFDGDRLLRRFNAVAPTWRTH